MQKLHIRETGALFSGVLLLGVLCCGTLWGAMREAEKSAAVEETPQAWSLTQPAQALELASADEETAAAFARSVEPAALPAAEQAEEPLLQEGDTKARLLLQEGETPLGSLPKSFEELQKSDEAAALRLW